MPKIEGFYLWEGSRRREAEEAICLSCEAVFLRRKISSKPKQVYCSRPCRFSQTNRVVVYCAHCERAFDKPASKLHKIRNFCSRECKDLFHRKPLNKCLSCGLDTKNKFCSGKGCQATYQYKQFISKWLAGQVDGTSKRCENISPYVRKYMIKEADNKCSKCGWGETNSVTGKIPLQINHIDGDSRNSAKKNLEVLCPNCHSLTPNYGILNKGKGRQGRRAIHSMGRSLIQKQNLGV